MSPLAEAEEACIVPTGCRQVTVSAPPQNSCGVLKSCVTVDVAVAVAVQPVVLLVAVAVYIPAEVTVIELVVCPPGLHNRVVPVAGVAVSTAEVLRQLKLTVAWSRVTATPSTTYMRTVWHILDSS